MDEAKQIFYNSTQSEMIRTLIVAGVTAIKEESGERKESKQEIQTSKKIER